jgi:ferrous iron transport protein B
MPESRPFLTSLLAAIAKSLTIRELLLMLELAPLLQIRMIINPMKSQISPGLFNLNPSSLDEGLTLSYLLKLKESFNYQKVIIVVDWQRLAPSLGLALSILDVINDEALIVINKDDGHEVSAQKRSLLEEQIGVPVLPLSAIEGDLSTLDHFIRNTPAPKNKTQRKERAPLCITSMASSYLQHDLGIQLPYEIHPGVEGEQMVASYINAHLKEARQFLSEDKLKRNEKNAKLSEKIDSFALHPIFGGVIFVTVFYILFSSIYTWAAPAMDFTEGVVLGLGDIIGSALPEGLFKSLIVDGIFAGVGGVVIFLPQIMILFFLMSLLEQSGYISRAALIVDRIMSWFGLGGKAFLPYLSGYACAIPGIMAARTIPNPKERYATIMTLPLITCSARLPVYILLVGTFVPSYQVAGLFHSQALAFFFLYFLGSIAALIIAKILRLSYFKGESSQFILDLPRFQMPSLKVALYQAWLKGRSFLKKAGTIILGLSLIIWLLSTFPRTAPERLMGLNETKSLR